MNGIMDRVQVQRFGAFCQVGLAGGCTVFGFYAHFQILFGAVGNNFAQQFRKLSGMFCFFVRSFFPVQADFRIAFPECDAGHGQVHAYFGAFAVEVGAQVGFNIFGNISGYAYNMFSSPGHIAGLLYKFGSRSAALGAFCRGFGSFIHIAANRTNEFFHDDYLRIFLIH